MSNNTLRRDAPLSLDIKKLHALIDDIDDYQIKIHQAARWYAENGVMIVPFRPGDADGKYSGYPKGLSQRHASKQLSKIDEWWHPIDGLYPGASIAMAHGGQAGFCAIDLDNKEVNGIQVLADLEMAHGDYNDGEAVGLQTLMAFTPSGGRHLVFRYHPEIISNSEITYPGVDTRGGLKKNPLENGGITFVEPSRKPGKAGKCYRWDESVTTIIDMPQWLVDVLNGRQPKKNGGVVLQEAYVQSGAGDHGDGRDRNIYMDLMRFVGIGYDEDQLWALAPDILARMDPPDEEMVRRKIESAINSEAYKKAREEIADRQIVDSLDLDRNDKNQIIKTAKNLEKILNSPILEHEYGTIEYDDFYQRYTLNKKPLAMVADYSIGIQIWLSKKFGVEFPAAIIRSTIEYIAFKDKPHSNIARDYMLNCGNLISHTLPRDPNFWGSGRAGPGPAFQRLCTEVLKFEEKLHADFDEPTRTAYEGFLWFWLQGAAARACVPGCKMEIVLNIFGEQGIGKSTFFRDLCPDPSWFTDSIQDSIVASGRDNRDELSKLHAKLIVEMPELSPIKKGGKAADDKIKQFISTQVDHYRRPYGQDTVENPRTCVLGGTSNNNDIYRDITGTRRFVSINHGAVPIGVGDQDTGVMDEIRDQLWGELVSSFKKSELSAPPNHLLVAIPPALRDAQSEVNNAHRYEEIGLTEILEWMEDKTRVTWAEIITQARTIPGLRDAKESVIMVMVRQTLRNDDKFQFKRRITRTAQDGTKTERVNCWVNTELPEEKDHRAGLPVPPHWDHNSNSIEGKEY